MFYFCVFVFTNVYLIGKIINEINYDNISLKGAIDMLKLKNIKKDYVLKGVPTVHALKGITVNFRRSEFVAVLGASGCGKTTLLNIIGGLDRYTSGDLVIEGKSTKDYNDRDWDTYRNHSIGFVFQSYNLISHQSILGNVELALTISGVSKKERKERAAKALEVVGLKGMEKKKPNQLSGGQMQRVAIARALVNDPEILLADEPTGALDSETSVQIMDLLQEVALDRLVIMVTHNPDLADTYANRIITMKDGLLTGDSNPYVDGQDVKKVQNVPDKKQDTKAVYGQRKTVVIDGVKESEENSLVKMSSPFVVQYFNGASVKTEEQKEEEKAANNVQNPQKNPQKANQSMGKLPKRTNKGRKEKTSMSFFTATGLSFANLISKFKRTMLVMVAGSIGIIGVSSVLAVSNGVNNYVHNMQDDMLSRYPLEITEQAVDYTSLMSGLANMNNKEISDFDIRTEVGLDSMINYLMEKYRDFTSVKTNDINDELIDYVYHAPEKDVASISLDYGLDLTNNIFSLWQRDATSEKKYMSLNGLTQMYIAELRTVEGFAEYAMFVDLFTDFMKQLPGDKDYILSQYDLVGNNSHYPENANEIVLVVDENQTLTDLIYAQMGFYQENEFLNIARKAIESQKEEPDPEKMAQFTYPEKYTIDDIIGKEFKYYAHDDIWTYREIVQNTASFAASIPNTSDPGNPYTFNGNVTYNENTDELEGTISSSISPLDSFGDISVTCVRDTSIPKVDGYPFAGKWNLIIMGTKLMEITWDTANNLVLYMANPMDPSTYIPVSMTTAVVESKTTHAGYMYDAKGDPSKGETVKIAGILKKKDSVQFGCLSRGVYYTSDMTKKMMNDAKNSQIVTNAAHGIKSYIGSPAENDKTYSAYVTYTYTSFKDGDAHPIYDVPGIARALNTDFNSSLSSMLSITGTTNFDVDKAYLRSLSGIATKLDTSGYIFDDVPQGIAIYPQNFNSKKNITKYLDKWNAEDDITLSNGTVLAQEDRHELTYTDTIEIIVNVINTLITTITIALVAFTSLSLVVSCFMIAVITYISTMERVKEIGVIRSLGGRKKDVSRLFIAECLIIGLASGVFGIAITYLLSFIFNLAIMQFGVGNIAALPLLTALIMIGVSILLNVLSGLIPAMKASSQDPVVALRTE